MIERSSAASRSRACVAALLMALALAPACSGGSKDPDPIDCWPGGGTPGDGVVEIGIGDTEFEPVVEDQPVALHIGLQGLGHIFVHARVKGMVPGSKDDRPNMPYVYFSATLEDGTKVVEFDCALQSPFVQPSGDFMALENSRAMVLSEEGIQRAPGNRVLLKVEVLDRDRSYATDERWVVPFVDDPLNPDAGPADAGVADAGSADAGVDAAP